MKKLFTLMVLVLLASCSEHLPPAGVAAYEQCRYQEAQDIFVRKIKPGDKNEVLYVLAALSSATFGGDSAFALKASGDSQRIMWSDAGKGRGVASLASAESLKIFKGEPFEKAFAAIYAGLIYYNQGDFDNARASFSKAHLAIQKKRKDQKSDFALAHFLLAHTFVRLKEYDNAKISIEKAKERYAPNPYLTLEHLSRDNVIFMIEKGSVPIKVRVGPGGSLIDWARRRGPGGLTQVSVGDQKYESSEIEDLFYQATSKESTAKDSIQAAKGVAREAAIATAVILASEADKKNNKTLGWVALGAGLFALANQSQADTRQWELLPESVDILSFQLPVGQHRIRLEQGRMTQDMDVEVDEKNPYSIYLLSQKSCEKYRTPIGRAQKQSATQ